MTVQQVIEMIDRLPPEDRRRVAEHVQANPPSDEAGDDSDIPLMSADEFKAMLDGRIDDLRSGRVRGIPMDEFFRRWDERKP